MSIVEPPTQPQTLEEWEAMRKEILDQLNAHYSDLPRTYRLYRLWRLDPDGEILMGRLETVLGALGRSMDDEFE